MAGDIVDQQLGHLSDGEVGRVEERRGFHVGVVGLQAVHNAGKPDSAGRGVGAGLALGSRSADAYVVVTRVAQRSGVGLGEDNCREKEQKSEKCGFHGQSVTEQNLSFEFPGGRRSRSFPRAHGSSFDSPTARSGFSLLSLASLTPARWLNSDCARSTPSDAGRKFEASSPLNMTGTVMADSREDATCAIPMRWR